MEANEQSQKIVVEESTRADHDEIVEYKIIATDDLANPESQTFCTSEDGTTTTTEYKFTYHADSSQNTIEIHDGSTQYLVFSSLEEDEQSGLVATAEEIREMTQEQTSSEVNKKICVNEIEREIPVICTKSDPTDMMLAEGTKQIIPKSWSSFDETIELVVRQSAEGLRSADEVHTLDVSNLPKKKSERDPMALPFSYAGQSFNVQSQKLILNVMHFFKTHKKDEFIETIKTPQEKAARVLNISSSVIGKIRKNWKNGKLVIPGKNRKMSKRILDRVDASDEQAIRDIIRGFSNQNIVPAIPLILSAARQKINFVGSRTSFRRILHRMGYRYGKVDKKMVMLEPGGGIVHIHAELTTTSVVQPPHQQQHQHHAIPSSTSAVVPTLIRVLAKQPNQVQKPNMRPRPPKSPSGSSSVVATAVGEPQIHQFEKIQFIARADQHPQVQQFTTPVQAYSHDLPISVATPQPQPHHQTHTFHLVHQPE